MTWLLDKIIPNKTVLGFLLEIFYLGLAVGYLVLVVLCAGAVMLDINVGVIIGLIIGLLGMFALGYGIMHYHKTYADMSNTEHDGYEGSYDSYSDTVTVREKTKESLSWEGGLAVLTSPLQVLIRFINLILMFRCIFDSDYVCDLAIGAHPDEDGALKMIFIDVVNINRY